LRIIQDETVYRGKAEMVRLWHIQTVHDLYQNRYSVKFSGNGRILI
jgi:hypothetical protein